MVKTSFPFSNCFAAFSATNSPLSLIATRPAPTELFTLTLRAVSPGDATFTTDPADTPSAVLHGKLATGELGEKSGKGFYSHPDPKFLRPGWLAGVDRDLGKNFRIGAGYNFTDFSDDLTDFDYDHKGWFLNLVGSY
mgnify:CR=1 FL=1